MSDQNMSWSDTMPDQVFRIILTSVDQSYKFIDYPKASKLESLKVSYHFSYLVIIFFDVFELPLDDYMILLI
jgi:hypothetical protein